MTQFKTLALAAGLLCAVGGVVRGERPGIPGGGVAVKPEDGVLLALGPEALPADVGAHAGEQRERGLTEDGDPDGPEKLWRPFTASARMITVIGDKTVARPVLPPERLDLFKAHVARGGTLSLF